MYHGGFGGGGGGGWHMHHLHSALDAGEEYDILGKVYDAKVVRRLPRYLTWVKSHLALAATGTLTRTLAGLAMPYLVKVATDDIVAGNVRGLNMAALGFLGAALLIWGGQYLETLQLAYAGQGILFRMRTQMFDHLHKLSLSFFEDEDWASFSFFIRRDLRRAALLGWITPFSAALSKETVAVTTAFWAASRLPEKINLSALVMLVLHRLRTDLFRNCLLSSTCICFSADLVTGKIYLLYPLYWLLSIYYIKRLVG